MSSKNKPLNILFLHTGAELYGSDQTLLSVVTNLDKTKFKSIVALPNSGPLHEELKKNKITTEIIPYPIIRRQYFTPKGIINYIKEYRKSIKSLTNLAKREKIDIIHNNTIAVLEGISVKKTLGIPLITHIHEMLSHPKIIAKMLYRLHLHHADRIIAVSRAVKTHIGTITKTNSPKISVIHNGINLEKYSCTHIPRKNNAYKLAIVGRINAIKGQSHFIGLINRLKQDGLKVSGAIIGDTFNGQEWRVNQLKQEIRDLKLETAINFEGFQANMAKKYSEIDILILPSIDYDSFPTVVLEAMASGIPTVAYRCGGVEEMILDAQNGYLVNWKNENDLFSKTKLLINNLNNKTNIMNHQKIRSVAEKNFSITIFIAKLENLYLGTLQ